MQTRLRGRFDYSRFQIAVSPIRRKIGLSHKKLGRTEGPSLDRGCSILIAPNKVL
jgi:hypothetical protein